MQTTNITNTDEVLIAFVEAGTEADLPTWMCRYPEHQTELANAAATRWLGEPLGTVTATNAAQDATAVERLRTVGRETARAFRAAMTKPAPSTAAQPLTSLVAAAKARGLDPAGLAERLRLPYALFFKLQRRLIAPDSVPRGLAQQMADALGRTRDEINAYLRMPPTLAMGASYRADDTPRVGARETFADALASDPDATADQIAYHIDSSGGG